jgi:hypothetical protein
LSKHRSAGRRKNNLRRAVARRPVRLTCS